MNSRISLPLKRAAFAALFTPLVAALAVAPAAFAGPGLPRTYDVQQIDSPNPIPGGAFGWGVAAGDYTGDGKPDMLVPQAQHQQSPTTEPSQIFLFNGANGSLVDTINQPEDNPDPRDAQNRMPQPPTLAFVYVEHMPDIGSCRPPGGLPADGPDPDKICDLTEIGGKDGIPEIIAGSRNLRVNKTDGATPPTTDDQRLGRAYIFDGATRTVLKRIDMPKPDRQAEAMVKPIKAMTDTKPADPGATPQFGRLMMVPQGLAPCAGPRAEANNLGVGPCPDPIAPDPASPTAERIGDVVTPTPTSTPPTPTPAGPQPDIVITARNFVERTGAPPPADPNAMPPRPAPTPATVAEYAATGSQCASAAAGSTCTGGRAWVYAGEDIVGTSPTAILDTARYTIKDPESQTTGSPEFGGNMFRLGDVGSNLPQNPENPPPGTAVDPAKRPDGRPDFVIPARQLDYPIKNPDTSFEDAGAAFLFDGPTGARLRTYVNPEPQARAQFSGSFNSGLPVGDIGVTALPDLVLPAALQNNVFTDAGKAWAFTGEPGGAGGGATGSLQFSDMSDPTPQRGENFGGSISGAGNLVDGEPGNELMIGGFGPFDPATEETNNNINDVHIFNGTRGKSLQDIPDPGQERGSGFGVGMTPMGDLNGDGFLDFAVTSYQSNAPPNGKGGQGRAFIFRSNNSGSPAAPGAGAAVSGPPRLLRPGRCANDTAGTNRGERLGGTEAGDRMFGFGGKDLVVSYAGADCIDGGSDNDRVDAGGGADRLLGGKGNDKMYGREEHDRLFGMSGKDTLYGGFGDDLVAGGSGNDVLEGGSGNDRLFGETGNDLIRAGATGRSGVDGGRGNDRINARNRRRDSITCGSGFDRVLADRGDIVRRGCERVRRK